MFNPESLRRDEFPWSARTTYLNHASTGPLPVRTVRALEEFNRRRMLPHTLSDEMIFAMLDQCRALAARLINADAEEIALTTNTTFGLGLAARMTGLRSGDIVLASDREFPANVYPWVGLRELGVTLELVPVTPQGWPDEDRLVSRLADPRVRVLSVSLVQFSNGFQFNLDRLSRETRATGTYLIVDAMQALGQVPVDVSRAPVDVLACGGQKWLLSPWGSGFMYVRRDLIERFHPPVTGWMAYEGTDDFTRLTSYSDRLRSNARRFEMITLPYQDMEGFRVSLELVLSLDPAAIHRHILSLHAPVLEWAERDGIPVTSPRGTHGSGILCVAPPDAARAHQALRRADVIASLREGAIRLSPHCYNTVEDMARVVDVLRKIR